MGVEVWIRQIDRAIPERGNSVKNPGETMNDKNIEKAALGEVQEGTTKRVAPQNERPRKKHPWLVISAEVKSDYPPISELLGINYFHVIS